MKPVALLLLLVALRTPSVVLCWTFSKPSNPSTAYQESKVSIPRNLALIRIVATGMASVSLVTTIVDPAQAMATIDVNNAMAREFTAFPGLYPTVATKIVNAAKEQPFTSKKEVYAVLNEMEQERLRQYDKSIIIAKPDKALQQFKTSQICKYECGSRTSNSYRDEQIKAVQAARSK
jgi:hypothetical protein